MLKEIPLSKIKIKDRVRSDKGDIEALAATIEAKGLIQPITVDQDFVLLAGERRYLAATFLKWKTIPTIVREGDKYDATEIEMIENTARKDLTWQEKATLDRGIYDHRLKKNASWSHRDQARLTAQSPSTIDRRIKLAEAMELIPELGDYPTEDEAWRSYKRLEEGEVMKMQKRELTTSPHPAKKETPKKKKQKEYTCGRCGSVQSPTEGEGNEESWVNLRIVAYKSMGTISSEHELGGNKAMCGNCAVTVLERVLEVLEELEAA